jgi:putative spermidine/putrescine transport system permease protein
MFRSRTIFAVITATVVLPLAALVLWSLSNHWYYPHLLPESFNPDAWAQLVQGSGELWNAALTSFLIAVVVTLVATAVGFPAGRILALRGTTFTRSITWLLLFPAIAPPLVLGTGVQFFYVATGLAGTFPGVVLAHLLPTLPFATFVSMGIFANFNLRYEEQARTLGASPWQTLWHVSRPALQPGMIVVALFSFLISWAQYALTIQIGYGRITTLPVLVFGYIGGGNPQFAAAAGLLMIVPTLFIIIFAHKNFFQTRIGQW